MVAAGLNGVRYVLRTDVFCRSLMDGSIASTSIVSPMTCCGRITCSRVTGGLTNPAPGVFDFDDWRALQPMFDAAKQAGIFITLRPGGLKMLPSPSIN